MSRVFFIGGPLDGKEEHLPVELHYYRAQNDVPYIEKRWALGELQKEYRVFIDASWTEEQAFEHLLGRRKCESCWQNVSPDEKSQENQPPICNVHFEKYPSKGERCSFCNWTNVGLLNIGEPQANATRWICHPCTKRVVDCLERLATGDHLGTPINEGCTVMVMIERALSGKDLIENHPPIETTELVHRCRDMATVDALAPEFKVLFTAIADRLEKYQFATGNARID